MHIFLSCTCMWEPFHRECITVQYLHISLNVTLASCRAWIERKTDFILENISLCDMFSLFFFSSFFRYFGICMRLENWRENVEYSFSRIGKYNEFPFAPIHDITCKRVKNRRVCVDGKESDKELKEQGRMNERRPNYWKCSQNNIWIAYGISHCTNCIHVFVFRFLTRFLRFIYRTFFVVCRFVDLFRAAL